MNMDVGMHHVKNRGNKEILSNTIKDTSKPSLHSSDKGLRMIVLVSLIVLLRISLFPRFFAWCTPTSIFIQLNDFYTCIYRFVRDYKYRILYCMKACHPLMDSANMNVSDWAKLAKDVERYYDQFEGFVILHGTDTMCYTASALSFMLENLNKPVVLMAGAGYTLIPEVGNMVSRLYIYGGI